MIGSIQGETQSAITSIEAGNGQARNGAELAQQAASSLERINDGARETMAKVEMIATSVAQQNRTGQAIADHVGRIREMAETNNAVTAEALLAVDRVECLAENLREIQNVFKLGSAGEQAVSYTHLDVYKRQNLEIHPFPVPYDAREPVQFAFSDGAHRLGVLTDTGSITQHVIDVLRVCDALVLECNHDSELLAASSYPMTLQRRISGNFGHLSNRQAVSLLLQIETRQLQHIVAAHLSEQNNRRELVVTALAAALNCTDDWIGVAGQEEGFGWRRLI